MQLIGLLTSPFVRRVAISLKYYGIPFEHYPLSAFGDDCATLEAINPVAKLPTLVLDNGDILLDSSLILEYFESQAPMMQKLLPTSQNDLAAHLKVIGLALVGCEKSAHLVYELRRRPEEKHYQPWIDRLTKQIHSAFTTLEQELSKQTFNTVDETINQASITIAVAWSFNQFALPGLFAPADFSVLSAFTNELEALPIFRDTPIN